MQRSDTSLVMLRFEKGELCGECCSSAESRTTEIFFMTWESWLDMLCLFVVRQGRRSRCQTRIGARERTRVRSIFSGHARYKHKKNALLTYRGPAFSLLRTRFLSLNRSFFLSEHWCLAARLATRPDNLDSRELVLRECLSCSHWRRFGSQ